MLSLPRPASLDELTESFAACACHSLAIASYPKYLGLIKRAMFTSQIVYKYKVQQESDICLHQHGQARITVWLIAGTRGGRSTAIQPSKRQITSHSQVHRQ
jgi:hypothetical protein